MIIIIIIITKENDRGPTQHGRFRVDGQHGHALDSRLFCWVGPQGDGDGGDGQANDDQQHDFDVKELEKRLLDDDDLDNDDNDDFDEKGGGANLFDNHDDDLEDDHDDDCEENHDFDEKGARRTNERTE